MGEHSKAFVLKVRDLIPLLGVSRNTAYELVRDGVVDSFRLPSGSIRIPVAKLEKLLGTRIERAPDGTVRRADAG